MRSASALVLLAAVVCALWRLPADAPPAGAAAPPPPRPAAVSPAAAHIVRFREYLHAAEHRARLEAALPPAAAGWAWVPRDNPAAALPTDFGLVRLTAGGGAGGAAAALVAASFARYAAAAQGQEKGWSARSRPNIRLPSTQQTKNRTLTALELRLHLALVPVKGALPAVEVDVVAGEAGAKGERALRRGQGRGGGGGGGGERRAAAKKERGGDGRRAAAGHGGARALRLGAERRLHRGGCAESGVHSKCGV